MLDEIRTRLNPKWIFPSIIDGILDEITVDASGEQPLFSRCSVLREKESSDGTDVAHAMPVIMVQMRFFLITNVECDALRDRESLLTEKLIHSPDRS